jgi:glutamate synthase (NADPH/NADH) small chain
MGKITGFLEYQRLAEVSDPVNARVKHYREFVHALDDAAASKQGARCMDCGIPFCQSGCPVHNVIPDWNDLVYRHQWKDALDVLHSTNNFPEFTGRVCPAPCEAACTLNINSDPVGIKSIEHFIVDKGWEEGWIVPQPPANKTGRRVAVIGGLLRYGIPDFKMEKHLIDRRMAQMSIEGVEFRPDSQVGGNVDARDLLAEYDAIVLAGGAEKPRDLPVPGRELRGVHFAMDFLPQQNRVVAGDAVEGQMVAAGKHVIVIGGGDTGSDCVGTSNRQGAASVTQFELLQQPPAAENKPLVWPYWPIKLRTSSSHEEGCERDWSVSTKRFEGSNGQVERLVAARVEWQRDGSGAMRMVEMPGTEFVLKADLVLLAMGFTGPGETGLVEQFGVERDARSNVKADTDGYRTSVAKVFAAGDIRRGQSLVVWAIREGRQCAHAVDAWLMGSSELPR